MRKYRPRAVDQSGVDRSKCRAKVLSRKIEFDAIKQPLFIGLWGPPGLKRTVTALRLASGIEKTAPGGIVLIDTENGNGRRCANRFNCRYIRFGPPFGSLDYLKILQQAESLKPSVIVVDCFSHEHSGDAGYLQTQSSRAQELAHKWRSTPKKTAIPAWTFAAEQREKLLRHIAKMDAGLIACFRSKNPEILVRKNRETAIGNMNRMPEAGKEFISEMTLACLLLPGSDGRARFQTGNRGEKTPAQLPEQFPDIFQTGGVRITESIGEKLAKRAAPKSAVRGR